MKRTEAGGHRLGVALVTLSAVIWSTAGFFTRLIATDTWTLLFWRSVFGAVFLLAALVWQERSGALRAIGATNAAGTRAIQAKRSATGRAIESDEVASCVSFLCSPLARNLTGEILTVDGGFARAYL